MERRAVPDDQQLALNMPKKRTIRGPQNASVCTRINTRPSAVNAPMA
jgi:hypothetical protein